MIPIRALPGHYALNDIYPTVQGEGCLAGTAMVVVRLHGCGVGCPWCDTKETWTFGALDQVDTIGEALGQNQKWCLASAVSIASYCRVFCPGPRWILLTGGEPAEQDLAALVAALHASGYKVAIETSGTALGHVGAGCDWVCVSPKIGMPGGKTVDPAAVREAHELKQVVGKMDDVANLLGLLETLHTRYHDTWRLPEICLQPVSCSEKATALCIAEVVKRGWRLSIQTHKILSLR